MPMKGVSISREDANKIIHIALPIGKDQTLMASDALESFGQKLLQGNNVHISVHPDSKEEADRLFTSLSEGGKVHMPIADQPWGDYYGNLDKYGVHWMINYHREK
jgi:PhnB protein